ncbi:phospholipase A2 inhibitor and Ly6/PLAUR domain-containing protein-like isoform X2 [Dendropsophus ebraccatus]|uniref:phospholipase A2 inhibitor and Ly6/PLAUR domain-containing protein-like isoform X2 n=1 Tax=Dendropsophus ebraccatus TaxID=150705 RepID=UPI003831D9CF
MIFSTNCCYNHNCKTALPTLPPENNTHNGLVCPATSTFLDGKYKPTYAMKCTGDEEYCFNFTSRRKGKEFMTGCASSWYLNSLLCWQCQGSVDHLCEQYEMCSTKYDACVTTVSKTSYGGKTNIQLLKRCGFSSECNSTGTITTTQGSISRNTTCCYADDCFSPTPTLPPASSETNGHICESCYIKDHGSCTGRDRVACTGIATQCISYTKKLIEGAFTSREIFHGCAHPSICHGENISVTYNHRTLEETKMCRIPAKSSVQLPNILCASIMLMLWSTYIEKFIQGQI